MQRYQPPHLRQRAAQDQRQSAAASSTSLRGGPAPPGPSSRTAPLPSRRDWSTPPRSNGYALASPASDLQPMRRTPVRDIDEMDMIQSVSRSGGDGAEGDALKDPAIQDRYRRYIDERLDKHYAIYSRSRTTAPPATAEEEIHSLGSIVLLFRKLREGVVASHRIDDFAIEVFESSARLSILARNTAQLLSSLSGLVPGLYTAVQGKGKAKASDELDALTRGLSDLQVTETDRRAEFASILLLFHLTHTKSRQAFQSTLIELTLRVQRRLRNPFAQIPPSSPSTEPPFISRTALQFAVKADKALAEGTFDPLAYFRLLSADSTASPYERAVLAWAADSVKERSWRVLSKAYMSASLEWVGRWGGCEATVLESWVEENGGRVENGVVKLR